MKISRRLLSPVKQQRIFTYKVFSLAKIGQIKLLKYVLGTFLEKPVVRK
jgi:hypothetical protein